MNKLVSDLVPLLRTCTHGQRIRIDTRLGGDPWPAMVEPSQAEAAIFNLALNARDAMPTRRSDRSPLVMRRFPMRRGATMLPPATT